MPKEKARPKTITMAPNVADYRLLSALCEKLGVPNKSSVIRLALKRLAEAEGVRVA